MVNKLAYLEFIGVGNKSQHNIAIGSFMELKDLNINKQFLRILILTRSKK